MKTTFSVTQAQAQLPKLVRSKNTIAVSRHGENVAFIVPREKMEALLETIEILSDPKAMIAIRDYEAGKTKFNPLSALDED